MYFVFQYLEDLINFKVVGAVVQSYKDIINSPVKWTHSRGWEEIISRLNQYVCGNADTTQKTLTHFAQVSLESMLKKWQTFNLNRQLCMKIQILSSLFKF